jgi:hypothetical protein
MVDDDIVVDKMVLDDPTSRKNVVAPARSKKCQNFYPFFNLFFSFPLYFDEKIMNEGQHYKQYYPFESKRCRVS